MAPFISEIKSEDDFDTALSLMDELFDDYDSYKPLIDMLAPAIEEWENNAEEFDEFNKCIANTDKGVALLATLMEENDIKASELENEIGGKSLVSLVLSGKRNLTVTHILALSQRRRLPGARRPSGPRLHRGG